MSAAEHLPAFLAAAAAVLVVPGPSVAYAVARTVENGRGAGLFAVLGLETGLLLHVLAAAAGLAAVISASGPTLTVIKVAGAGFLAYLGVAEIRHASVLILEAGRPRRTAARLFRDAVLVDLLNPKTALFVLAFLPQFVEPEGGAVGLQSLVLGLYLVGLAFLCDGAYALLGSTFATRLRDSARSRTVLHRLTGCVYISLGGFVLPT